MPLATCLDYRKMVISTVNKFCIMCIFSTCIRSCIYVEKCYILYAQIYKYTITVSDCAS